MHKASLSDEDIANGSHDDSDADNGVNDSDFEMDSSPIRAKGKSAKTARL